MHKHYPSPFVICIGTMKHLFTIFSFIFLCLGIIALSQEEQPGSQIPAESPEGSTARYAASECSFNSSSDCTLPDNSHSLFNNGTDSYGFNNALCPANAYTHYNVSTKCRTIAAFACQSPVCKPNDSFLLYSQCYPLLLRILHLCISPYPDLTFPLSACCFNHHYGYVAHMPSITLLFVYNNTLTL